MDGLIKALSDSSKENYADLTHGGRLGLFFTDEERTAAKADHEAALSAGFYVGNATWLSKEEVWKVSTSSRSMFVPSDVVHRRMVPHIQAY